MTQPCNVHATLAQISAFLLSFLCAFFGDYFFRKRHTYNISPELQVRVEVLKDMLMYRVDKRQCILTNDELESIIRFICTE